METLRIGSYREYYQVLQSDADRYEEFCKRLTINVSEFFRNPERFQELERKIFPKLLEAKRPLKVWSAGCSTGPEPYSLAIILSDLDPNGGHKVIASDIDRVVLEKAKSGLYHPNELRNVSPERMKKYFQPGPEGNFQVTPQVKKLVEFRRQNLLTDTFDRNLDLILCRNVVIYFTEEAKQVLYEKFFAALAPGGVLLVGGTEPLLRYREYGFECIGSTFYQKPLARKVG
jgi:chemotaxis protein methyltransferase CheR